MLDYCPGGELFFHLTRSKRFDENRARFYAACIVLALEHLHKHNIVYRDLKPENILIDADGFPKITDFGLSKDIGESLLTKTFCGTPEYLAPETLLKTGHSFEVDWWSLGCLIYEMLVGIPPYYVNRRTEIYRRILSEDVKYPQTLNPVVVDLLQGLLMKDPSKRLGSSLVGIEAIKMHPWFASVDWQRLEARQVQPQFVPYFSCPTDIRYFSEEFTSSPARDSVCFDPLGNGIPNSPTYEGFAYIASPYRFKRSPDSRPFPRQSTELVMKYISP